MESETGMQMAEVRAGLLREEATSEPERLLALNPQHAVQVLSNSWFSFSCMRQSGNLTGPDRG